MEALWTDTLGKRHSLRSKRFRRSGLGVKKDRGKGFLVLTARELKREPKNGLFLIVCSSPAVQTLDIAIHRINHYPVGKYYGNQLRYPLDSDLSGG